MDNGNCAPARRVKRTRMITGWRNRNMQNIKRWISLALVVCLLAISPAAALAEGTSVGTGLPAEGEIVTSPSPSASTAAESETVTSPQPLGQRGGGE